MLSFRGLFCCGAQVRGQAFVVGNEGIEGRAALDEVGSVACPKLFHLRAGQSRLWQQQRALARDDAWQRRQQNRSATGRPR